MKKYLYGGVIILLLFIIGTGLNPLKPKPANGEKEEKIESLISLEDAFVSVVEKVKPSVVNLSTETKIKVRPFNPFGDSWFRDPFFDDFFKDFFPREKEREYTQQSLGSGFIVNERGYILTNYHMIKDATKIRVTLLDGRKFDAKIVGSDPKTDLALIKIDSNGLPVARLGDSDRVKVGSWAIAIGNPFGFNHTVTIGVISAKERTLHIAEYENFLQTDASINPGNSGGPLVNIKGEVIGINTAIVGQAQGIGFAIPINMAKKIIGDLIEHGKVIRAWLGIYIQDLTEEIVESMGLEVKEGVLVSEVMKNSPAEKEGIKRGDVIISIDNEKVKTSKELQQKVLNKGVGKEVEISLIREGNRITLRVKLEKMPEEKEEPSESGVFEWLGMSLQELKPEIAEGFGFSRDEKGILVSNVQQGTKADEAGIRRGDIIKEIDREEITSLDEMKKKAGKIKKKNILFLIKREGYVFYTTIERSKD
ncbi:MAG: Do family serine endopeptidase [bacterium]